MTIAAQDGERVRLKFAQTLHGELDRVLTGADAHVRGQRIEAALKQIISAMPGHREVFVRRGRLTTGVAAMRLDAGAACSILEIRVLPARLNAPTFQPHIIKWLVLFDTSHLNPRHRP